MRTAIIALLVAVSSAVAQEPADSTRSDSTTLVDRIQVQLGGAHYYQMLPDRAVLTDPYLYATTPEDIRLQGDWGRRRDVVSDNPLYHGAGYLSVAAHVSVHDGVRMWGELVGEHRGSSYGISDTRNMAVIPRFRFTFDTSATVFGETFRFGASVGHLMNLRFGEGLMLYNMDALGTLVWIDWWKLRYYYEKVGDGYLSIGMNIGDYNQDGFELRDLELFSDITLDARVGAWSHPYADEPVYPAAAPRAKLLREARLVERGFDVALALESADSVRIYAEMGHRLSEGNGDYFMNRSALVVGAKGAYESDRLSLHARGEYRYYGGLFNAGFSNVGVRYREPDASGSNTIGPHVYPLAALDRPFSQWAVFTEYQDLKDVTGYTLQAGGKLFVWDRISLHGDLDLNYLLAEGTDGMLYPFFDAGIGWEPLDDTGIYLSITNKGMNLDKSYPTFYLYATPAAAVTLRWNR